MDATGNYTVDIDGTTVNLVNTIPGTGWRAWKDTSEATITLTEGAHTLKVTNNTAGPNIRAFKIAPVGIPLTVKEPGGTLELFDKGLELCAVQMKDTYAVQFNIASSFDFIDLHSASWNNSKGSLELALYRWDSSYAKTLQGQPTVRESYIDFFDGAVLRLKSDTPLPAGEYLLYIDNISEDRSEAVGFWAFSGKSTDIRNYKDDAEADTSARIDIHYLEDTDSILNPISQADGDGQAIKPSEGDLYPQGEYNPCDMDPDTKWGVQFKADSVFSGAEVYIPATPVGNDSHLTLSLYKWDANYATSVRSAPVATVTLEGLARSSWVGIDGSFPAGEYLLVLTNGTDRLRVAAVYAPSDRSVTYLHTAKTGISLVVRLKGENVRLGTPSEAAPNTFLSSGTWVGVDGLGRELPSYAEVGGLRENKYVGLFFHTWHAALAPQRELVNATEIITKYPDAIHDYNHPAWGGVTTCFWNEPIWGYYNTIDHWVLRKQAEMLADAGVDVVFFDNTNGTENYISAILELCSVWAEARADGVRTPQISCLLNMYNYDETAVQLIDLYEQIYSKGLYADLWFMWEGKPLMIGYPQHLISMGRRDVLNFFSYRTVNPSYTQNNDLILPHEGSDGVKFNPESGFARYTAWKWISVFPQQQMMKKGTDEVEQMCVSVAQNWSKKQGLTAMNAGDHVFGRGYTNAQGVDTSEYAVTHGLNFAEQFEYALKVDPTFIWITGWNEWEAGRYEEMWGDLNAIPDNALDGYSRDIEPSTGLLKDHFYYQMVSYIRRFKGVEAPAEAQKPIDTSATIDWSTVLPVYNSYEGNTLHRDADGYKGYHYTNTTGRNDIVEARVTYDVQNLYFWVRTAEALTPETDPAWMRLLLDIGGTHDGTADWESYEYIVNRVSPANGKATLEKSTSGWNWETVASVDYTVSGDTLVITVPRASVGADAAGTTVNFKWSDNMQKDGDIMDFYVSGDVAPGGRFKYSYTLSADEAETTVEETTGDQPVSETPTGTEGNGTDSTETETQNTSGGCRSAALTVSPLLLVGTAAVVACTSNGKRRSGKRKDGNRRA